MERDYLIVFCLHCIRGVIWFRKAEESAWCRYGKVTSLLQFRIDASSSACTLAHVIGETIKIDEIHAVIVLY